MNNPKLILLEGFAGVGKTTIAERYTAEHPLAMNLEGDRLVVMLGQWIEHEAKARELVFELGKVMAATCLEAGHDVVVPMLPTTPEHARGLEEVARKVGAQFFEVVLTADRDEAVQRLLKRGTWGEEGTDPLTEADMPVIDELYDGMERTLAERPDAIQIPSVEGDHDDTYAQFWRQSARLS